MRFSNPFLLASVLLAATVCGGVAGGIMGAWVSRQTLPSLPSTPATTSTPSAQPEQTSGTISLIPLERQSAPILLPPAFANFHSSALASLYRKPKGATLEERFLGNDRLLGQAIALTSDGWFVTSAGVLNGMKISEVTVWHEGTTYGIERAILDRLNDTLYLKVLGNGFPATAFAHVSDLSVGAEVWIENRPQQFAPAVVLNLHAHPILDPVSSEVAGRRLLISGKIASGDQGGAVWDPSGSLIGLVEAPEGEWMRVVPISSVAASFSSLLASGSIQHASLGVRAFDLSQLKIEGSRGKLPVQGAWIHDDKKNAKLGVGRDTPAAKAGLRIGDVIIRIERDILDGAADLGEALSEYRPHASVTLRVVRDGVDRDIPVTLASMTTSENVK